MFIECLLYSKHRDKHFTCITSTVSRAITVMPILWMKDWVCERLDNFVQVSEPINGRVQIQTHTGPLQSLKCDYEVQTGLLPWISDGAVLLWATSQGTERCDYPVLLYFPQMTFLFHKWHSSLLPRKPPVLVCLPIPPAQGNHWSHYVSQVHPTEHLLARTCQKCLCKPPGSHGMHMPVPGACMLTGDAPLGTSSGQTPYSRAHYLSWV